MTTKHSEHGRARYNTVNDARIRGRVRDVNCEDTLITVKIHTSVGRGIHRYPKDFIVRVPSSSVYFDRARVLMTDDLVLVRGPVLQDNSIAPREFERLPLSSTLIRSPGLLD